MSLSNFPKSKTGKEANKSKDMSLKVNSAATELMSKSIVTRNLKKGAEKAIELKSGAGAIQKVKQTTDFIIPEKLKAHIPEGIKSNKFINEGISLVQTADEGLINSAGILHEMRQLASLSAANATEPDKRVKAAAKYEVLKKELQGIIEDTEYDGKNVFDGTAYHLEHKTNLLKKLGKKEAEKSEEKISIKTNSINADLRSLGALKTSILSAEAAQMSLIQVASSSEVISNVRSQLASFQSHLLSSSQNILTNSVDSLIEEAKKDPNVVDEKAIKVRDKILEQTGKAILAQANSSAKAALKFV